MATTSTICSNLCPFWYPMCTSGSGIGASFGFHQSPLPLVASSYSGIGAFLWISPEPSSVYPCETRWIAILFELCEYLFVLVANRTFLPEFLMLNISFGCCRHSVSNTFVQLTEGRSARDQPKQPPAKKNQVL